MNCLLCNEKYYDLNRITIIFFKIYLRKMLTFLFQMNTWDLFIFYKLWERKNHNFFNHYQLGRSRPFKARPIVIRRYDKNLTRYFKSFEQHSDYYNFYDPDEATRNFLNLFSLRFVPKSNLNKVKIKSNFSILNFQPPEQNSFVEITDGRIWSTDIYHCVYFNDFVGKIYRKILTEG